MTAANYPACYKITRQYEGGNDDDPRDPGGRTSRGIIQREYDQYRASKGLARADVWRASEDEIAEIYRTNYWDVVAGDKQPAGVDLVVWDAAVNSGPGAAKRWQKASLNSTTNDFTFTILAAMAISTPDKPQQIKDFCARRLSFLEGLRTWGTFGRGWGRRVANCEAVGTRMALAATGTPPAEVRKSLNNTANAATKQADAHRKAATGTGPAAAGAGGAHATVVSHIDWTIVLGYCTLTVAALVCILYFVHWYRVHKERSYEFADAAAAALPVQGPK